MSSEFEVLESMTDAMKTSAQVNAAGIAQRQDESIRREREAVAVSRVNARTNALNAAVRLNGGREKTSEQIIEDAEKLLAWMVG